MSNGEIVRIPDLDEPRTNIDVDFFIYSVNGAQFQGVVASFDRLIFAENRDFGDSVFEPPQVIDYPQSFCLDKFFSDGKTNADR